MNAGILFSHVARVACIALLAFQVTQGQTTIGISPAAKNALPGTTFSLNVVISNAVDLHLYHIVLQFDNTIVRCEGVSNGDVLPGTFFLHNPRVFPSDTARFVTVDDALGGMQSYSGSGTLFSIQFTALQPCTTPVSLVETVLRDTLNQSLPHTLVDGAVSVFSPPVVYVDVLYSPGNADGHDFGFDAFSAIAPGVSAVIPGGTVYVHPGTYREQIYINKDISLLGAGASGTVIVPPAAVMNQPFLPARQERPVIGVDSLGANVIIDGFTVDGEGAGNTQPNMVGIQYFKGSGVVRNCTVKRIRSTPFSNAQAFIGIMVNHDYPRVYAHSLEIHSDSVYDFGKGGIVCNHPGTVGNVHHNVIVGQGPVGAGLAAQNGVQFGFGATGSITYNVIANLSYTGPSYSASGILGVGSDGTLEITNNTLSEVQTAINLQQLAAFPSGGTSAGIERNAVSASVTGTGVPTYYGVVSWSMGGALLLPRSREVGPVAVASPYGMEDLCKGNGGNSGSRPLAAMAISLRKNSFVSTTSGSGVGSYHLATESSPQTVTADSNVFNGNWIAVVTDKDPGALLNTTWRRNWFAGNNYGMVDQTEVLQDAKENWWGHTTGPRDIKSLPGAPDYNNPGGLGDSVTSYIDYKPWYLNEAMTSLSQQSYGVAGGWNMVSVPLEVADARKTTLFPTAVSNAFAYVISSGYVVRDTLLNGAGYWLKFAGAQDVSLNGLWRPEDTLEVGTGWNMIGTISDPIRAIMVQQVPPTIVASPFYGFNGGYAAADTLWPARGYWVKINHPGVLIMSGTQLPLNKGIEPPSPIAASTLTVSDAHGVKQTLLFSMEDYRPPETDWELPPPAPAGVFDVRFASNLMWECVKEGEVRDIAVRMSFAQYPVTVQWDMQDPLLRASLLAGQKEIPMNGDGSETIADESASLVLRLGARASLPGEFALDQNYPNPFNPVTRICYQLPLKSQVSLRVFDVLGREVATLVEGTEEAGYRSVLLDARHLASGTYFYRLRAGTFVSVRKLILLR